MINNSKEALFIIRKYTADLFPGCKILLFGSRAKGLSSSESDYDFLVITKNEIDVRQKRLYKSLLRKELAKYKIPADILIHSENEVEVKMNITGHILKQVMKEGIAL